MDKIALIIDTDPGIDDAVAIAIAAKSDKIDLKLVTTVAGNVSIDNVTFNALKLLKFLNREDVLVSKGFSESLVRKHAYVTSVHGMTGMDGFSFPEPDMNKLSSNHAVVDLYQTIINSETKITLMPIAPLTNIAILLKQYPEVKEKVEKIVLMGGAFGRGNFGVYSEFNIKTDPEAAKIVFESGLDIYVIPMDIAPKALIYPEDSEKIRKMNKFGEMFYDLFKKYRGGSFSTGLKMYDACAIAFILEPSMFVIEKHYVEVDIQNQNSAGITYIDFRGYMKKEPNIYVVVDVESKHFKEFILNSINSFS